MKVRETERGYEICEFVDGNGQACSLQQSSAIGKYGSPGHSFVWLGVDEQRMHLEPHHVKALIKRLTRWHEHGSFRKVKNEMSETKQWLCSICDEWYDPKGERAKMHEHPEPQGSPEMLAAVKAAMATRTGHLSNPHYSDATDEQVARWDYEQADAMLEARSTKSTITEPKREVKK